MNDDLESPTNTTEVELKVADKASPVRQDESLEAVNRCLEAAAKGLGFDIAELWRFARNATRRTTGMIPESTPYVGGTGAGTGGGAIGRRLKMSCDHVYAQAAILKTYTGRIAGIWNTAFDDSKSPQSHVLSPSMCEQARASECPLWFTSTPSKKLHPSLPLNTAVVLPVHLDDNGDKNGDYIAVFLSLSLHERNMLSLDFLGHISKAATGLFVERGRKKAQISQQKAAEKDLYIETHLRDVPVVVHPGEKLNTGVDWGDLHNVEFLVNGSRCTIYTAIYKQQSVVVKLMRKDVQDASAVRRELELELELLRRIRHENVVRLVGAGTEPEQFLVIARLDGGTLAQRCSHGRVLRDRRGRFTGEKKPFEYIELLRCGRQLAEGLRYLHEEAIPGRMVVHRDLKPDNIGFSAEGDVKLLDLGLSRLVSKSEVDNATYNMTGETGSLRYMAPEVAESRPYNEKVDVYSYGMVLWEMTTLKKPFEDFDRDQLIAQVVRGTTRPSINKRWPKAFRDLMQACWSEDMHKRPSFKKIGDTLQTMLQEGIGENLHRTSSRKPGLMSKLGLKNRHSSWF